MVEQLDRLAGTEYGRPPVLTKGPLAWGHKHLFNSWLNSLLTIVVGLLLAYAGYKVLRWAIFDSVWVGTPDECRAAAGACWALITERHRLMLFGLYPYQEQWRPALAVVIFVLALGISTNRALWGRKLLLAWVGVFFICGLLMRGGILGLSSVPAENWGGLPLTLLLSVVGILLAFPLAIVLALGRRSNMPVVRAFCVGYIELIRGVPLITILFMASVMLPLFLPVGMEIDKLLRAQVGIILFAAAYLAEVIRGGLQAIPKGQSEAADALGLNYPKKMALIIMPQALRLVIPPLVNTFIGTFKDTSLVIIIGLFDLLTAVKAATNDPVWRSFTTEGYIFAASIFFFFCFFMSKYSQHLEKLQASSKNR